ncbi:thioesterase [Candidimonas nitroreducens]|uniref:Thioesterase n=2 Tax=Candidimonas nitroreducens TaxID=683354 RepID=A0A225MMF9_9BURK|nr:thioesterase [Candidimonas nitroreducens]
MMRFERELTIEWGDCDEAGIVFYPNYFYWFDCTFQGMLRSKGLSQREVRSRYGAVTPLVDVGAVFRSPVSYDDVITIRAEFQEWAERRMRIAYTVHCGERLVATGHELRAWAVPREEGGLKGAAIPEDFKRLFA